MSKRSRKYSSPSWLSINPLKRKGPGPSRNELLEGIQLKAFSVDEIRSAVQGILERAKRGIWYRLLPLHDDTESLYYATSQNYDDMLAALYHVGLIVPNKKNGKVSVKQSEWQRFSNYTEEQVEVSQTRRKGREREYFICVGKPIYPNAEAQQADPYFRMQPLREGREVKSYQKYFCRCRTKLLITTIESTIDWSKFSARVNALAGTNQPLHIPHRSSENDRPQRATLETQHLDGGDIHQNAEIPDPVQLFPAIERNIVHDIVQQPDVMHNQRVLQNQRAATAIPTQPHNGTGIPNQHPQLDAIYEQWLETVETSLVLDFSARPRMRRDGETDVKIHGRKQADAQARELAVHTARAWGYHDEKFSYKERLRIAQAACNQVGYDLGYKQAISWTRLSAWDANFKDYMETGNISKLDLQHKGRVSYVDEIEAQFPGYVRELFRNAQNTVGNLATYFELANNMNAKSASPGEHRPALHLHEATVRRWFISQNGSEKTASEKPRITEKQMIERIHFSRKWFEYLKQHLPAAFLDEKWFYTTSR